MKLSQLQEKVYPMENTQTTDKPKTDVMVIKEFFGMDTKTAMVEIKALSGEEKTTIAGMCRTAMGIPALETVQ